MRCVLRDMLMQLFNKIQIKYVFHRFRMIFHEQKALSFYIDKAASDVL